MDAVWSVNIDFICFMLSALHCSCIKSPWRDLLHTVILDFSCRSSTAYYPLLNAMNKKTAPGKN